jgi:hypothetical protein
MDWGVSLPKSQLTNADFWACNLMGRGGVPPQNRSQIIHAIFDARGGVPPQIRRSEG